MIRISTSTSKKDLEQIVTLQQKNLSIHLSAEEKQAKGFVTIAHRLEDLQKMALFEPNIVAKDRDELAGYVLTMTRHSAADIPNLLPMFESFNHIRYKNKPVAGYNYLVVGQVCIDAPYRGKGLFDQLYQSYKNSFQDRYDFAVTEVASINLRSMKAHERIGFTVVHKAIEAGGLEWNVVVWDWTK